MSNDVCSLSEVYFAAFDQLAFRKFHRAIAPGMVWTVGPYYFRRGLELVDVDRVRNFPDICD